MNKSYIEVSIICNTYNHKQYIRDALDGFIMQHTNFAYEILIHDDASSDGTADIIREYEQKYPDLIKPIYQKENQYSKGIKISTTFQYPRAKGKYIALCEGDDYWLDPYKLQKQYDALEANSDVDICAHSAFVIKRGKKYKIKRSNFDRIIPINSVIGGGGGFVATSSLMFRKSLNDCIPAFRKFMSLDYTMQIHGALRGGMLYLHDFMSVYRLESSSISWSSSLKNSVSLSINHLNKTKQMLQILNKETSYKFNEVILNRIKWLDYRLLFVQKKYSDIKHNKILYKCLPVLDKIKINIRIIENYFRLDSK